MFKTYNVVESAWQMNLFLTLQVCRNLSSLDYLTGVYSSDEMSEEEMDEIEEERSQSDRRSAA